MKKYRIQIQVLLVILLAVVSDLILTHWMNQHNTTSVFSGFFFLILALSIFMNVTLFLWTPDNKEE